jgi:hypothetical protein
MTLAARLALVLVACAAIVPLAIWYSVSSDQERAEESLGLEGPRFSERRVAAEEILRDIAGRTPSSEPELILARATLFDSRPREAAALLRDVVEREPENHEGWSLLAIALERIDPSAARRARARALELSPLPSGP